MKQPQITGYTFTPAARQVDFSALPGFDLRRLYAIANLKTGALIYAVSQSGLGYTALAGSVLTLAYDTTAMGASDPLFVLYDGDADPASPAVANAGSGARGWLATIAGLLKLGTQTKAASASVTLASDLASLEPAGAAITGVALPAGGTGLTGWLSAIYKALTGTLSVTGPDAYLPNGTAGYTTSVAATLFTLDTTGYESLVVHATSVAAQVTVEQSNDGSTWVPVQGVYANTSVFNNGFFTFAGMFVYPIAAKSIRARSVAAGAVTLVPVLRAAPYPTAINIAGGNISATPIKATSGGLSSSVFRTATAAAGNVALVKSGAGKLHAYQFTNSAAAKRVVHLYDSAVVTLGTTADLMTIVLPAGSTVSLSASDLGAQFNSGLSMAVTTGEGAAGAPDATVAAIAVGDVTGTLIYA